MTSQLVGPRTGVDARGAPETIYRCSLFSFLSLALKLQLKGCLNLVLCPTSVTTSLSSMDSIRVNRRELVGKAQNNTAVLEALIRANALNCTTHSRNKGLFRFHGGQNLKFVISGWQ